MTQPLTGERSRAESLAELYDRHAAGLFAYSADQLGDLGSATDVLATVLTGAAASAPPRAALYGYARREIRRRDVVYAPPAADPLTDPASALVERALRELRPHQREVLVLSEVCGLDRAELAWALDVAPDTAQELLMNAAHRYRRLLAAALSATVGRAPRPVADVYGALQVAPLRDVLGRLPWPTPPAALRVRFAGSRTAGAAPLFVRPRWPVPPEWPLPLNDVRDPATTTGVFPAELLAPPAPGHRAAHEATTAPMPKVRDPLAPTDTGRPGGRAAGGGTWSWQEFSTGAWQPFPATTPGPHTAPGGPSARPGGLFSAPGDPPAPVEPGEQPFYLPRSVPADVLDDEPETQELPAITDAPSPGHSGSVAHRLGSLFTPREQAASRQRAAEPVYRMPSTPAPTAPQHRTSSRDFAAARDLVRPQDLPVSRSLAPSRYFSPSPDGSVPSEAASGGKAERRSAMSRLMDSRTTRRRAAEPASDLDGSGRDGSAARVRPDSRLPFAAPAGGPDSQLPGAAPAGRSASSAAGGQAGGAERGGHATGVAEADASKAGADGREAEADARKAEADARKAEADARKAAAADRWAGAFEAPARRSAARSATKQSAKQSSKQAVKPARPARKGGAAPRGRKPRKDRHHDWAWEAIGFLVCVAIAMVVFFAMPTVFGF
ncbi:DNA-directed RNA polymerase specialized sigma24 family protein [Nonomuraea muscovyensis]|uniref:DNA-directed RNA polymerase specialized sigma24 family protein n=1 Tax=Nonomuraea muscovyensis TaxID=1124761 RepID=A0A7X0CAW5_9ACTN|nr:sigma factor-like helix-turn-helix DNA-binding protein [Nonomuraea muscovyensis]MBB6351639.1 DNA-directed RNA polymerase specialized sigma24 family protein [Nonomuraea muscovyensis]